MIYSRTDCYGLLIDAIERAVVPLLTSPEAQMTCAITVDTLKELAKHEAREPAALAEAIVPGISLGKRAAAVLAQLTPTHAIDSAKRLAAVEEQHRQTAQGNAEELDRTFKSLLGLVDELSKQLLEHREAAIEHGIGDELNYILQFIAEWELRYREALMGSYTLPRRTHERVLKPLTPPLLEKRLRAAPGNTGDLRVTQFDALPGGMSKETFMVTTQDSVHGTRHMVVRKSDPEHIFDFDNFRLSREYALVRRVHDLGLPVAEPYWFFPSDGDVDGDYYVMRKMEGKVSGTVFDAFAPVSEKLLLELAAYLARQHSLELEKFEDYIRQHDDPRVLGETIQECMFRYVKNWQERWTNATRLPSPGEAHTLNWMLSHVPRSDRRPVLVHADCSIHNFLAQDDKITAVMDWEGAHFGDPTEDVAYVRGMVSKYMDWQKFLRHYRDCGGLPIDESNLRFYECLVGFRNYAGTNKVLVRLLTGERADIRMLPLAFTYFPNFMQTCIAATRA